MELTFRVLFGITFVLPILYRIPIMRRFAQKKTNEVIQSQKPIWIEVTGFASFLGVILASVLFIFTPDLLKFATLPFPFLIRLGGVLLAFTGIAFFMATHRNLGENFSPKAEILVAQELVVNGLYQWVRHPMYLSLLILYSGQILLSANGIIALTRLIQTAVILMRVKYEESALVEQFGENYRHYCQTTNRFVPSYRAILKAR